MPRLKPQNREHRIELSDVARRHFLNEETEDDRATWESFSLHGDLRDANNKSPTDLFNEHRDELLEEYQQKHPGELPPFCREAE